MRAPQPRTRAEIDTAMDELGAAETWLMRDGLTDSERDRATAQVDAAAEALLGIDAWREAWTHWRTEALLLNEPWNELARVAAARAAIDAAGAAASPDVPHHPDSENPW